MKKSLLQSNPHLKDDAQRKKALARNIESSSAVEGLRVRRDAETGRFVTHREEDAPPPEPTRTHR